ncbi:SCP-2 sterol transfer family protein [Herbihabitans rhizosphaerae]|uniref:SCP-2 sterol transfer family protein n=1 Tax=Herbihabitans rhizosphaerae TaxID=1872711 RepID=A0A4Q7KN44_9PSEU|nr:SCP2 sterol-binding domain-containing protein [Herbihabitans rhizosphaerae]RZS37784.1 SCP-2 sterol transfer family protein [Herbihabitans rhizosphaerae]
MSNGSPDVEAIGKLDPGQLIELLERLDPAAEAIRSIDLDAIAASIDPTKIRKEEFVRLMAALHRLTASGAPVDLGSVTPEVFARLIARASKDQIDGLLERPELRRLVLDEIFLNRMPGHLRKDRAEKVRAVVNWRISGGDGEGGCDRYEMVVDGGVCTTRAGYAENARATITISPVEFIKLITSNASAPVLFMTGKLKVRGDLAFAAGLTGLFDLPRA